MKKFIVFFFLFSCAESLHGYTHKVSNFTLEEIRLKVDQKWCRDKNIILEPAKLEGDTIKPSETIITTDLGGAACTNGIEARGTTGSAIAQLTGLCLIPQLTEKSRNLEVNIFYKKVERTNGKIVGEGLEIEVR